MIPLIIGIIFVIFCFTFCEPSKRLGLFLPFIWVVLVLVVGDIFENSDILSLIMLLIGVLCVLVFLLCAIETVIRVFNPDFDFVQRYRDKKEEKRLRAIGRFPGQLDMYSIFPNLRNNKEYEAIYNHCRNNNELIEFTKDWQKYFLDLQAKVYFNPKVNPNELFFTFEQWYEENERWRNTSYHHLYYGKQASDYYKSYEDSEQGKEEEREKEQYTYEANNEQQDEQYNWFRGISNYEELRKRYKELLKIYHPDNQAGDTSVVQEIQTEYERILKSSSNGGEF